MKYFNRFFVLMLVFSCMSFTKSSDIYNEHNPPGEKSAYEMNMSQFVKMSLKDMAEIKGRKLTIKEKIQFKFMQLKAQKDLLLGSDMDSAWWLWFIVGLLLGPLGWLLAFFLSDGNGRAAAIGCIISIVLWGGGWALV